MAHEPDLPHLSEEEMNIKDFIEAIEPLQATTTNASPEEDLQLMSITSIAISLKRIADALTEGTAQHYGVVRSLHNIEYNTRAAGGV
jgi:hypothetical protein